MPALTRRRLLVVLGGSAASAGLLACTGSAFAATAPHEQQARLDAAEAAVLAPASVRAASVGGFGQAAQTGFAPINSALTFGPPADVASGWDGTLWAIDPAGAPHVYDAPSDSWQLHGTGIDAAALIDDAGPAVYFRAGEVFVADGRDAPAPIASVWPQLPPSYRKFGVKGAAWANGKLVLFRGGTYLSVPWPDASAAEPVYHAAMQPASTPQPTAVAGSTATVTHTPSAIATPSPTPSPARTVTPTPSPAPSSTPGRLAATQTDYVARPLTAITGWPQTDAWQHGVVDGVYSQGNNVVLLLSGGEYVTLTFGADGVPSASGPTPLGAHAAFSSLPADWQRNGFDAGFFVANGPYRNTVYAYKGPQLAVYATQVGAAAAPRSSAVIPARGAMRDLLKGSADLQLHYAPDAADGWPATWHPRLQHAPSGRTSGLWAATVDGRILSYDGSTWTQQPGDALSVSVGKDGSVFAVGRQNQQLLSQWNGSAFTQVAQHTSPLGQVSVGSQRQVWTRDSSQAVHQLVNGQLQPAALVGSAAHIAANDDGTVWSCTGSDPHALRLASDLNEAPQSVPAVGTVQKVASTGFGAAHCLTTQNGGAQLYRYDSPYVFRSPAGYAIEGSDPIEQGLGSLFFAVTVGILDPSAPPPVFQVVAVDAHTGRELSRSAAAPAGLHYTPPVFDPIHELVIVGLTTNTGLAPKPGSIVGLDARDLSNVRWTLDLPNGLPLGPGRPTLQGTLLCVSDNALNIVMYDTGTSPDATTPTYRWTYTAPPPAPQDIHLLPPPVIANGSVYAAAWLWSTTWGFLQLSVWKLDAAMGTGSVSELPYFYPNLDASKSAFWTTMARMPPLLATRSGGEVLFVSAGTTVWRVDVGAGTAQSYHLPGSAALPNAVASGFALADNVLWFGDDVGNLYGLNDQLVPVPNTPALLTTSGGAAGQILATPVPYTDAQGNSAVLLSVWDQNAADPGLMAFDPTNGNATTIPTQGTTLLTLSRPTNGVVYAGGSAVAGTARSAGAAQLYALRIDAALQGLRDFVVDSQLMQDFDDPSRPNQNPNGVARYQTHLTLIDAAKAPLVNEPVKVWADKSTSLMINGQTITVGPDDDQFAAAMTSSNGTLVIVSGYTQPDGSDTTDMSATTLRIWASFMNPYERLLVLPDREYHDRVATAHATDSGQAGADDPTRANLQTAQTYGDLQHQGKGSSNALFTDQQKQDNQPQQVAQAIQTMTSSVGTTPPVGGKQLKAAWSPRATGSASKYVAYSDTPGAQYSPVNVAAARAAVVLQTTGLTFSRDDLGTQAPTFSLLTPAAATMTIDALDGQDWSTSQHAPAHVQAAARASANANRVHLGDLWSDFWDWLKGAAATITHIIVSVAEDVYAGIRFIVDGVAYVFNTIIGGIEQAVNAIGAFFVELGHLIEEVIEALSVVFQFGHIIDTHNILKAELLKRINGDGSSTYPGLATLVATQALPQIDTFFGKGEQAINSALDGLANALGGAPVSALKGSGATAHSTFSATPRTGGASSSTVTQGTWALHKFNGGIGAGGGVSAAAGRRLATDDPITAFFTAFADRLSSDGNLTSQWAQVKSGAQSLGSSGSAADVLKQGLAELLRILAVVLDGALAVGNALLDGLLGQISSLISTMFDAQSGILTTPLDIPVLSWLYQLLFGEPLTLLNALLLVISIPVTILWRIIEGQWPSDSVGASAASRVGLGAVSPFLARLMGYANAITTACLGFVFAAGDVLGDGDVPLIIGRAALAGSVLVSVFSIPSLSSDTPAGIDWTAWGVGLGIGLLNMLGSISFSVSAGALLTYLGPGLLSALSIIQVFVLGIQFGVEPPPNVIGSAVLGIGMAALLPGVINPIKLSTTILAAVVAVLDVVMGFAGAVAILLAALA